MGTILDTITVFKDSLTGSAYEALAAASGDSLQLRWFGEGTQAELLEAWGGNNAHKNAFSIRSPLLHDNTRGIVFEYAFNPTMSGADGNPQMFLAPYWKQKYQPTDTLIIEANGTASDDVTFTQLVAYDTPNYSGARLMTAGEVDARNVDLVGIQCSPSAAASTSTYGTAEAINADDNRLKANTDYALVGITTDLPFTTVCITGPDTANFPIPIPGHWNGAVTAGFFYELSRRFNRAYIPVINANNAGNTTVKVADAGGGTAPLVSLQFVELS